MECRGIPFLPIPGNTIPVHSGEQHSGEHSCVNSGIHQNSTRMENTGIDKLAELSAKFHSTGFHQNSTGMTRFLQE